MRELYILDDATIYRLLQDNSALERSGLLREAKKLTVQIKVASAQQKKSGCGCRGSKANASTIDFNAIKSLIVSASPQAKNELKGLLGAKKIRLVYVNSRGVTTQVTF
jgi:hypothetical protein